MLVYLFPHSVDHFLTRRVTRWSWAFSVSLARTGAGVCLVHWCRAVSFGVGSESQMEWLPGDRYTHPTPTPPPQIVRSGSSCSGRIWSRLFSAPSRSPGKDRVAQAWCYGILIPAHARRWPGRRAARCPVSQQHSLGSHVPRALDPATES